MNRLLTAEELRAYRCLERHLSPEDMDNVAEMLGLGMDEVSKKREHRTGRGRDLRRSGLPAPTGIDHQIEDEKREVSSAGFDRARGAVVQLDQFRRLETKRIRKESSENASTE